jgi:hypothetical protein
MSKQLPNWFKIGFMNFVILCISITLIKTASNISTLYASIFLSIFLFILFNIEDIKFKKKEKLKVINWTNTSKDIRIIEQEDKGDISFYLDEDNWITVTWKDGEIEVITPRLSKGERVIVSGCKIGTEIKMLLPNKKYNLESNPANVKATVLEINDHFEEKING